MFFRRQQPKQITFDDQLAALRAAGFETERQPDSCFKVSRGGCAAIVGEGPRIARAGWVVGVEIAALVDGGYQKFWRAGDRRTRARRWGAKPTYARVHTLRAVEQQCLARETLKQLSIEVRAPCSQNRPFPVAHLLVDSLIGAERRTPDPAVFLTGLPCSTQPGWG